MTISGVGPIVSLAFKATVDDPTRFKNSKAVAAHLGLTPRVYQSGELDISGHISKCGDRFMRHALYEAANSHLRIQEVVVVAGVGPQARQTGRHEEGVRRGGAQARDHHAPHVAR